MTQNQRTDGERLDALESGEVILIINGLGNFFARHRSREGLEVKSWASKKTIRDAIDAALDDAKNETLEER